jgi:hypothetical protein
MMKTFNSEQFLKKMNQFNQLRAQLVQQLATLDAQIHAYVNGRDTTSSPTTKRRKAKRTPQGPHREAIVTALATQPTMTFQQLKSVVPAVDETTLYRLIGQLKTAGKIAVDKVPNPNGGNMRISAYHLNQ